MIITNTKYWSWMGAILFWSELIWIVAH
ncbi:hypothetical protein [Escherichia marmotae]|nr:hypothetical protein [Escherichia marmotae]